jgi:heme-degrading monooxygenase HmoA
MGFSTTGRIRFCPPNTLRDAKWKSGRRLPHSKTLREFRECCTLRQLLECGSPLPLWHNTATSRIRNKQKNESGDARSFAKFRQSEFMIARLWRGYSTPEKAAGYRVILLRQILPHINQSQGFGGSFVLERQINGEIEFLIITLWESMDAVRQFAGPKYARAVIHEEAAAFLTSYDTESIHYTFYENK